MLQCYKTLDKIIKRLKILRRLKLDISIEFLKYFSGFIIGVGGHSLKKIVDKPFNEKQADYTTKLTELSFYKKHYFEKKFEVYKELTYAILELNNDLEHILNLSTFHNLFSKEDLSTTHKELQSKIKLKMNNYIKIYRGNYPFYPKILYDDFRRLYNLYVDITSAYQYSLTNGSLGKINSNKAECFSKDLYHTSENILNKIKSDIDNYSEK